MKKISFLIPILCLTSMIYGDNSSQEIMRQQFERLVEIDKQIEGLTKQKLEYKAEIAQHLERGSTGILPGVGRRQSREVESLMQDIQNTNQQIVGLEKQRQDIMMALK
jgi:predicted  nucleic acid-binding Zn-ribbon protein